MKYGEIESELDRTRHAAVFVAGFEFEKPNDYTASTAYEKLTAGVGLSDRERRVLSSQLCRRILLNAAENGQTVMVFLPSAPDVYSMGEWARLLDYIDITIKTGHLSVTLFAPDAVGLCFASSLVGRYKKITADTGVCGSGCGAPLEEAARYWGIDKLPLKRASLSQSPAYVGQ